jgi:hypothetical protein
MTDTATTSSSSTDSLGPLIAVVLKLLGNRTIHKLAGTALACLGFVSGSHFEAVLGAAYAAAMHATGGLKKVPD